MNIGMLGSTWHTGEVQTEAAVYERIQWQGKETIMVGALVTPRGLFIPSRAERTEKELQIFGVLEGRIAEITAHRGSADPFALSLSLVW